MATLTISLDVNDFLLEWLQERAACEKKSVDEYVRDLCESSLRIEAIKEFVDDFESEFGAFTEEEMAEARKSWQG